jgi:hypothetical protein
MLGTMVLHCKGSSIPPSSRNSSPSLVVIPFVHGTNRHLDVTAGMNHLKLLLFDFLVFLVQSCMLFLLAQAENVESFVSVLILLLAIDAAGDKNLCNSAAHDSEKLHNSCSHLPSPSLCLPAR